MEFTKEPKNIIRVTHFETEKLYPCSPKFITKVITGKKKTDHVSKPIRIHMHYVIYQPTLCPATT
jgi:hypothetical protein